MDITVSKKATINTGNYSSITPSVSLTVHDVDENRVKEVHSNLGTISMALFLEEFYNMSNLQEEVKNVGIKQFFNELDMEEIKADFNEAVSNLKYNLTRL